MVSRVKKAFKRIEENIGIQEHPHNHHHQLLKEFKNYNVCSFFRTTSTCGTVHPIPRHFKISVKKNTCNQQD